MLADVYKFLRLPLSRKTLLVRVLITLAVARCALLVCSLKRIISFLDACGPNSGSANNEAGDILQALVAVSRRLPFATCLVQGLAGKYLLSRSGYVADLHIGVRKGELAGLDAHAWLTLDGQVILGNLEDLASYRQLGINR